MSERDWQKDWEFLQRLKEATSGCSGWRPNEDVPMIGVPWVVDFGEHWLQRVRELEAKWLAEAEEKIRLRYDKTQLEEQVRKLEAQAAVLRKSLENGKPVFRRVCEIYCETLERRKNGVDLNRLIDDFKYAIQDATDAWINIANQALSATAGRELLERVEKLEAVAEAARKFTTTALIGPPTLDNLLDWCKWAGIAVRELEEALAALKKGGNQE